MSSMYAIVLAGGIGSRLWPRSRNTSPKQLLDLVSERTMIQETVDRLQLLMPCKNMVIVVGENHAVKVREQLGEVPPENVLTEPSGRGTAPAIGLGLLHIRRLADAAGVANPVIGSFHADHVIKNRDAFVQVVRAAGKIAQEGYIVTLGITPTEPHTGYGYIERSEEIGSAEGLQAYKVARFVEKPSHQKAVEYLATGKYSWNSGMFIWTLDTIMDEYKRLQPTLATSLAKIGDAHGGANYKQVLDDTWNDIRTETIDVGIAEKSDRMAVVPADMGWSDVGDWSVVADLLAQQNSDDGGNAVIADHHVAHGTSGTLIYSRNAGKLIATIGLDNMIIVDLPDVLMVAPRSKNQEVKKIVEELKQRGMEKFL
jgi:mannose-1-phosphate guanylyltransferase